MTTVAQVEQRRRNAGAVAAGRRGQVFCKRAHLLVGANVYRVAGRRQCRRCTLDRGFYAYRGTTAPDASVSTDDLDPYLVLLRDVLACDVSLDDGRAMLRELEELMA